MPSPQERALAYREMMNNRQKSWLANEKALAGDAEAFRQLQEDWSPLLRWRGWDPVQLVNEDNLK